LVRDGDKVGLGTGSTVAHLVPAIAARGLDLRCTATSPQTEHLARELGLSIEPLDDLGELDITIDGADQVDPQNWLIKGGGAAHTREKIVAAAARRFVVVVTFDKVVDALRSPVPLEIMSFGAEHTLARVAPARWRDVPISPDGNRIADYVGEIDDPAELAARLAAEPGVVEHGLFAPVLVSDVLICGPDGITHRVVQ
jgi:ribose 5-phosphate isomerase A